MELEKEFTAEEIRLFDLDYAQERLGDDPAVLRQHIERCRQNARADLATYLGEVKEYTAVKARMLTMDHELAEWLDEIAAKLSAGGRETELI
jgi:hypothetical protein